ncbi:MAG: Ppx/GppA family phosphatase [Rhodospirillales bacterium]|jgi:exopolyphosphatase/guanosine-5'-triphosphate,3'-diphosphate pyrophosphatase
MNASSFQKKGTATSRRQPVAIIDIGSNSIRLCVYDGLIRTPTPMFNEKVLCALGQGLDARGKLNPEGVTMARLAIGRFVSLARAMGVGRLDVLATAAVRDAKDGRDFVASIERETGAKITLLPGEEEAKLAALGVMCGKPGMTGLVADLGGGSLDLVEVDHGGFGSFASLPLGVLRMAEKAGEDRAKALDYIEKHLNANEWLHGMQGKPLYAVGGAWRALARICIAQTGYPLQVLDNFTIPRREAFELIELISRQSRRSLEKFAAVPKKRLASLPQAALLLSHLMLLAKPERLIFSVYGLREGQFYKHLPEGLKAEDPLVAACRDLARRLGRFTEHADEIMVWSAPLFLQEELDDERLRMAAALLSDAFWNEHPDYRAEQAFLRTFRMPFMGLEHRERAYLALVMYARHAGLPDAPFALQARAMVSEDEAKRADMLGLVLRLAHVLTGGTPGILPRVRLTAALGELSMSVPDGDPLYAGEAVEKALDRLARALGLKNAALRFY